MMREACRGNPLLGDQELVAIASVAVSSKYLLARNMARGAQGKRTASRETQLPSLGLSTQKSNISSSSQSVTGISAS